MIIELNIEEVEGKFEDVARSITDPAPEWLPKALAHFGQGIGVDTSKVVGDFDRIIQNMQDATKVLETWLPLFGAKRWGLQCPEDVLVVIGALPGLKAELDRLKRKGVGRRPDVQREVCAAVIIEAWRIIHGKVQARSDGVYEACREYWAACGGPEVGATDDIGNWRRTVELAVATNHEWIAKVLVGLRNFHRMGPVRNST
jgi:hypothetical protein